MQRIMFPGERWGIRFEVPKLQGTLLCIKSDEKPVLEIHAEDGKLTCVFTTNVQDNPIFSNKPQLNFTLEATCKPSIISLEWHGFSTRLYCDGELVDEEWPIGVLSSGEWEIQQAGNQALEFYIPEDCMGGKETSFAGAVQYFDCFGSNTGVGDCMPFARDGRYCLYYLFDRRAHKSKAGLGAHQWAQISSSDLKKWTMHPMAIPVTEQWEGSICTGSLIEKDGVIFAFYAVRMSDGSPARMTWATSVDGIHFEKSRKYFALTEPYEPVSARDPMVFFGADGRYHMLVTTSLPAEGRYGGCLAHLVSDDLMEWEQLPPFIVPGYGDQPECADYFEWNGWYYLVFANIATARYRMSREPFGPWEKPKYDVLDTVENQVAKTAAYGDRRLVTGFLARYPRSYAGNAITHELVQRSDGTLGVCFVPEILPEFGEPLEIGDIRLVNKEGRSETELRESICGFRLKAKLSLEGCATIGGVTLTVGESEHRLDFDRANKMVSVMRPCHPDRFHMGDPRLQLMQIDMDGYVEFDMIVYEDILDIVFADGKAMVARLNDSIAEGCKVATYVQSGALKLENIALESMILEK